MSRLAVCLSLGLAAFAPAQEPSPVRPVPEPTVPARGAAGGVLHYNPSFSYRPEISFAPPPPMAGYIGAAGGYPFPAYRQDPMNGYLTGVASVTAATGQYWNDIQQAKITREQARVASMDTARKGLELEMWYERQKPKTQDLVDAAVRTDLERARRDPPMTEVWSGQSLNALLNNILKSPRPTGGPAIPLPEDTLRGLNLVDRSSRGNLSLAKDEGKINWPVSLQDESFDGPRDHFSRLFGQAMSAINSGDAPDFKLTRDMRKDLKDMADRLEDQVETLSPGAYLSGRRVINQLKEQVAGMSDPSVVKMSRSWRGEVKTVADLVNVCQSKGLQFGASASPGDERAYTSAYYAVRSYERDLSGFASR